MNRTRRTLLTSLCLLALLLAVPIVRTWQEVRQEQLNHALIAAVRQNDVVAVRSLLHEGADPNAPVLPKDTRSLWQRLVDLLRHKPAPHSLTSASVLSEAIDYDADSDGGDIDNADTVQALAEAGANINRCNEYYYARTPLVQAATLNKTRTVQVLLRHHADVNAVDVNGRTALMCAAGYHNVKVVDTLLKQGANVNARDHAGHTALILALNPYTAPTMSEEWKTVGCLLRHGASVQGKDEHGETVLSLACEWHDKRLILMLKRAGAKWPTT